MAELVAGAHLNWAASWQSIETLHITSSKTDDCLTWDVPTDLELKASSSSSCLALSWVSVRAEHGNRLCLTNWH
jgi:hypothetical protein